MASRLVADIRISQVYSPYETLVMFDFSSIPHADPMVLLKDGHVQVDGSDQTWSLEDLTQGRPVDQLAAWLEEKGPVVLIHAPYRNEETIHFG